MNVPRNTEGLSFEFECDVNGGVWEHVHGTFEMYCTVGV